eukprot:10232604-Alexandrium_andersonii.AAC.1
MRPGLLHQPAPKAFAAQEAARGLTGGATLPEEAACAGGTSPVGPGGGRPPPIWPRAASCVAKAF